MLGMGMVCAAALVLGAGLGWLLDTLFKTGPALLLAGIAFGVVTACIYTIAQFRKYLQ